MRRPLADNVWHLDPEDVQRFEELGFAVFFGPLEVDLARWNLVAWVEHELMIEYNRVRRVVHEIERDE